MLLERHDEWPDGREQRSERAIVKMVVDSGPAQVRAGFEAGVDDRRLLLLLLPSSSFCYPGAFDCARTHTCCRRPCVLVSSLAILVLRCRWFVFLLMCSSCSAGEPHAVHYLSTFY